MHLHPRYGLLGVKAKQLSEASNERTYIERGQKGASKGSQE